MGVTSSTSQRGMTEMEPPWIKTVQIPPELALDQMGALSDGINCTGQNSVIRHRAGHFDSDGARWGRGFTSGKHAFEIYFPEVYRGREATVGVGTESAPLYAKGKVPLVGFTKDSWGISLRTKRAFHRNAMVKKYPVTQEPLPDKFYMYLDADAGLLQFGSDVKYYGTALNSIPRGQPLHPMLSCTAHGACVTLIYRGTAMAFVGAPIMVQAVQYNVAGGPPPPPPYQPPPPPPDIAVVVMDPAVGTSTSTVITSSSSTTGTAVVKS